MSIPSISAGEYTNKQIDYENKLQELRKNKYLKLFVDIYPDPKSNVIYPFQLSMSDSNFFTHDGSCELSFKPFKEDSFVIYNRFGLNSQANLRMVSPHIKNNPKREKVINTASRFRLDVNKTKGYNISSGNNSVHLKTTILNEKQIYLINDQLNCNANILFDTQAYDRSKPASEQNISNQRPMRQLNISQVQKIWWSVKIDDLYFHSLNEGFPVVKEDSQDAIFETTVQFGNELYMINNPHIYIDYEEVPANSDEENTYLNEDGERVRMHVLHISNNPREYDEQNNIYRELEEVIDSVNDLSIHSTEDPKEDDKNQEQDFSKKS